MYVGLENADALVAIATDSNTVAATIPVGQAPQAIVYVPKAVPDGEGTDGLQPLGLAAKATHLTLVATAGHAQTGPPTSVSLFDQGLVQILQAAVTGLEPKRSYVLALSLRADGGGALQPLAVFTTNPAGAAIVTAIGPIRQVVSRETAAERRYLVVAPGPDPQPGTAVLVQAQEHPE
jgi:YVTN family beta-propeller protein